MDDDETVAVRAFCKGLMAVASKAVASRASEEARWRHENLRAALQAATRDDETIKAFILRGKD